MQQWIDQAVEKKQFDVISCEHSINEIYIRQEWQQPRTVINCHSWHSSGLLPAHLCWKVLRPEAAPQPHFVDQSQMLSSSGPCIQICKQYMI